MYHSFLNLMGFENYFKSTWKKDKTKEKKRRFCTSGCGHIEGKKMLMYFGNPSPVLRPQDTQKIHEIEEF